MSRAGKRPSGYSWLRDGLIPGQSALLETLWITPWVSLALASNAGVADVRFPLPVLLTLVAAPALTPAPFRPDRAWLGPLLATYFVVGLGWVALVRQQHLERRALRRSSDRVGLSWLVIFSAISGGMLAIALAAAAVGAGLRV